ncbi:trypsin-like cysteine/serine peptidase domain-containing protein [Tricladium varicosporioides]|nr:trypsin-like cysteine/serine peptidase domain-containing protein [Hymenoscyphus varicosporioides]
MSTSGRILRSSTASSSKTPEIPPAQRPISSPITFITPTISPTESIQIIPPGQKLPNISPQELKLLRQKQSKLAATSVLALQDLPDAPNIQNALNSTLIFGQYEAGTAVCISPDGHLLTCSHCYGDDIKEFRKGIKRKWLLFYDGLAVLADCRVWDGDRDLALLKIVAIESPVPEAGQIPLFAHTPVFNGSIKKHMKILCIGQPGQDDLESTSAQKTKYNLIEISEGTFQGMMKDVDPQDNSEIGTLMHDAWTYWGHSGAPLVSRSNGKLIGLHSSWDDQTAMRHGIPAIAIREFLNGLQPPGLAEKMYEMATLT